MSIFGPYYLIAEHLHKGYTMKFSVSSNLSPLSLSLGWVSSHLNLDEKMFSHKGFYIRIPLFHIWIIQYHIKLGEQARI